jgi:D-3-phosphoglycerate dehydrogenase
MKVFKILVVDEVDAVFFRILNAFSIDYCPTISRQELLQIISNYHGLVVRSRFQVDGELIQWAKNLQIIGRLGSGIDNINVELLNKKGIELLTAPEGNSNAVAEQTLGMMLSLCNNLRKAHIEMQNGIWDRNANRGVELNSLSVGIIGYGNVGTRLAEILAPFGGAILVYDKFLSGFSSPFIQEVELDTLLSKSDVVSIHIPLNKENFHFANAVFFSKMKKNSLFLNLSRGGVVDTSVLIEKIKNGHIKGAALDVFENENPIAFSENEKEQMEYLLNSPLVMCSPHIGGLTFQSFTKTSQIIAKKMLYYWSENQFSTTL